jgi:hypothetical protein
MSFSSCVLISADKSSRLPSISWRLVQSQDVEEGYCSSCAQKFRHFVFKSGNYTEYENENRKQCFTYVWAFISLKIAASDRPGTCLDSVRTRSKEIADVLFYVIDNQTGTVVVMIEVAYFVAMKLNVVSVVSGFKGPDQRICISQL